jgi:amino acid transporter
VNGPGSSTTSTVRKAGLFYFVFVMFSYTTGGPFGLEAMVTTSGPGMSLLYCLFIPLFLSIPVSLVTAELTTAMPVEGGFYRWSRAAFGDFWGFLAGWWNWSASFLLGGSYAVLFTDYLTFYFPGITGWKHWLVSFALIAFITWVNIRGIQMVGKAATIFEIFVFIPVIAMIVLGLAKWHHNPFVPLVPPNQPFSKVFGVGLALVIWGYSGYEQLSTWPGTSRTRSAPIRERSPWSFRFPSRPTFCRRSLGWPRSGTGNNGKTDTSPPPPCSSEGPMAWRPDDDCRHDLQRGAAQQHHAHRHPMPFTLAEDGYLPPFLTRRHPRYGTPWIAILISAAIYASLALHSLGELISIYVWLRAVTTVLTVLSAWGLRRKRPICREPSASLAAISD